MKKIKETITNKKFSIIYALTFFVYPVMLFCNWSYYLGDYVCVAIAVLLTLYMFTYIIFLRKKESISLAGSIFRFFLYTLISLSTIPLIMIANDFVNGYQETAWVTGEAIGERYYGWEAVINDKLAQYIFKTTFLTLIFYLIICAVINAFLKYKKKINENVHGD